MKAARATVELSALALIYITCGGVALALAAGEAGFGTTATVFAGLIALGVPALVVWVVRGVRNPRPLPDGAQVRTLTITSKTVAGAVPAAFIVYICSTPTSTSWLVAVACLLTGVVHLVAATLAARLERRTGVHVLRADNRFFLAH